MALLVSILTQCYIVQGYRTGLPAGVDGARARAEVGRARAAILESQLPYKTVNLTLLLVVVNNELTVL